MGLDSTTLGLIAGAGRLPHEIAAAARRRGTRVVAVGLPGCCDESLRDRVDELHWLDLGRLESLFEVFRAGQVREAVLAGKVSKQRLFRAGLDGSQGGELKLDERATRALAALADRSDDSILGAVAELLAQQGVVLRPQAELVPELLAAEGPLGSCVPTRDQWRDIEFGLGVAKGLAAFDIGQSVVVKDRAVMAVEAIEGTDEAIRRGAALAGPGSSVVKVAKPDQDPRFDLPAIGPDTLEVMSSCAAAVLAFEADATLVMDRAAVIASADAAGIAVVGVAADGRSAGAH